MIVSSVGLGPLSAIQPLDFQAGADVFSQEFDGLIRAAECGNPGLIEMGGHWIIIRSGIDVDHERLVRRPEELDQARGSAFGIINALYNLFCFITKKQELFFVSVAASFSACRPFVYDRININAAALLYERRGKSFSIYCFP